MSWDALLTAAMAGTRGQALEAPDEPWGTVSAPSPERGLLLRAGAWALYAQAGRLAESSTPGGAPAGADHRQPLGREGLALLRRLLGDGATRPLVAEAFQVMAARGLRLPHAMLPDLLARPDDSLFETLPAVLGERGTWLAGQRDDWAWAKALATAEPIAWNEAEATEHWEEGSSAERIAALALARRHAPTLAAAWLAHGLPKDKPEQRVALLRAIAPTLGPADEPFLEACLGDRAAQVRVEAARLLATLPGSAQSTRLRARADDMLPGDSLDTLAAAPPQAWQKAWEREGLTESPPPGVGPRAWWLWQAVAGVPPAHWEARFSASPGAIVARLAADPWAASLLIGLGQAAIAHGAGAWLGPLIDALDRALAAETGDLIYLMHEQRQSLLEALPPDALASMAAGKLLAGDAGAAAAAWPFLRATPSPWPEALAEAYLTGLRGHVANLPAKAYQPWQDTWYATVDLARFNLPPSSAEAVSAIAATLAPREDAHSLVRALDRIAETLTLRQRIQKEITA